MSATPLLSSTLAQFRRRIHQAQPVRRIGKVAQVTGLVIEADGPNAAVGDICTIAADRHQVRAEVVGFRNHRILLMPLGELGGVRPGCDVIATAEESTVRVGASLVGRVLDGLGQPIDGKGPLVCESAVPVHNAPPNPLFRKRITEPFETGVKAIDVFIPLGCGQRMGIFAGSGVGKSTLLGMMARGSSADLNVIALVGERGRELREFIEKDLGPQGMAKSVIVVATSDQPALVRLRAAYAATAIAEYFRDRGQNVLLLMDSVTRFAMSQREIGLAVGEAPSSRGYTPSVFSLLPRLLERTGTSESGSITAFYTVLVEGDDMNEPIADAIRGILDGHIILSRKLATANQFPAIDVLESVSRLVRDVSTPEELALAGSVRDLLAMYRQNEDLVSIGAYVRGTNPRLDIAILRNDPVRTFLRQGVGEKFTRAEAIQILAALMQS